MNQAFEDYLKQFDLNNFHIKRKHIHTYRVANNCVKIAHALHLSEDDTELAYQIGILHDIGRFHQLVETGSYDDMALDHADYGVKLLFEDGLIASFPVKRENYKIVEMAVKYHNKFAIESNLGEKTKFFCKLIRDADKIDILELSCEGIIKFYMDGPVKPNILAQVQSHSQVKINGARTNTDNVFIQIGFFYDIYFKPSVDILFERKIIDRLKDKVNDKIACQELDRVQRYLKERFTC